MSLHSSIIIDSFIARAEALLTRLESMVPPTPPQTDLNGAIAFRWRRQAAKGWLQPIARLSQVRLEDLFHVERQKTLIEQNTLQFLQGRPANNVLLTGARGTGKSSLIRACLNRYAEEGLRLIEIDRHDLADLSDIVDLVADRPERFIFYCDDLSFEQGDPGYKALKVALDGSAAAQAENVLIYATSNRRHLMPERMADNLELSRDPAGDLHPGETVDEKISLSDRFGLWLSFYPFSQDDYLAIVAHWLRAFGCESGHAEQSRTEALQWALQRGSRSGRTAWQFAKDWAGKHAD